MTDIVERLRYATRDVVTGQRLDAGAHGHAPIEDLDDAADEIERLRAELAITKRDALEAKQDVRDLLGLKVERDALRAERDALQLQIGELNDALGVIDHCQIKPLVDALRADAERYWWLRSHYDPAIWDLQGENEKLDAALDAARKQDD